MSKLTAVYLTLLLFICSQAFSFEVETNVEKEEMVAGDPCIDCPLIILDAYPEEDFADFVDTLPDEIPTK